MKISRWLARSALPASIGLLLTGCGPNFAVRGIDYDLSEAEAGYARAWRAEAPVEAAEACRYWDAKQNEAGTAHTRAARKVGDFRQLRLWTQANRIERCTDAGATDQTPATLPGAAQEEDAPPPPVIESRPPAEEDAPPPPSATPVDEDAPPPG